MVVSALVCRAELGPERIREFGSDPLRAGVEELGHVIDEVAAIRRRQDQETSPRELLVTRLGLGNPIPYGYAQKGTPIVANTAWFSTATMALARPISISRDLRRCSKALTLVSMVVSVLAILRKFAGAML
jgi:hypothetical protein